MQKLKTVALRFILSKAGAAITAFAVTGLGRLIEIANTHGIESIGQNAPALSAIISDVVEWVITFVAIKYVGDTNEKVQKAVGNVEVDRVIVPQGETLRAIARQVEPPAATSQAKSVTADKPKRRAPRITGRKS